jgi:hypothetical protein
MCSRPKWACVALLLTLVRPALAGPPYVSDDPEPTDLGHWEVYTFGESTRTREGAHGSAGIDLNYGAGPDLQLTAVLPLAYESARGQEAIAGFGNVELAAKYRFLHQASFGLDVSFFPSVILPSGSATVGEQHVSLFLPIWLEKDWGKWSTFGGGGCEINRGGDSRDFCLAGWVLTRQVLPELQLGAEVYHQTADTKDGSPTTGVDLGIRYDLSENLHLLASGGSGVQNASETNRLSWYSSILFTF